MIAAIDNFNKTLMLLITLGTNNKNVINYTYYYNSIY